MKVYIVTKGSYSDYHIKRVFLQKEKAEIYNKIIDSENYVEEYETSDAEIGSFEEDKANNIKPIWIVYCAYYPRDNMLDIYNIDSTVNEKYNDKGIKYYDGITKEINFTRSLPRTKDEDDEDYDEIKSRIFSKMLKISQDFWAIIQEQTSQGATNEEINKMLNAKSEE